MPFASFPQAKKLKIKNLSEGAILLQSICWKQQVSFCVGKKVPFTADLRPD